MPCSADDFTGNRSDRHAFQNWLGNVRTPVTTYYEPDSLQSLVWVAQEAVRRGSRLRAVGSGWSFEDIAACPDIMVGLRHLDRFITDVIGYPIGTGTVNPLTPSWRERTNDAGGDVRLVHVEAGIQLFELNRRLWLEHRWAMPSLGGSQGQTLAGAISTSTHGGDPSSPPLPDLIQAIHLVSHDGQEWWVESSSEPLTNPDFLARRLSCADVRVIQDDDLFHALQVSVGRFGVIYSLVLQVRKSFGLVEWAHEKPWSEIAPLLRESPGSLAPLLDSLPRPDRRPPRSRDEGLRHLEFLMNSRNGNQLFVRRRWEAEFDIDPVTDSGSGGNVDVFNLPTFANWVLQGAAAALRSIIPAYGWVPVWGAEQTIEISARAGELDVMALDPHMTTGRAMVASLNAIWATDDWGLLGGLIETLVGTIFDGRPELAKEGKSGASWQIMAGNSPDPGDTRVNSIELVFDGASTGYVDFIDFLVSEGPRHRQAGYVSIRYSRNSRALLSMHNFGSQLAVSVEIASVVGFEHNDRWMRALESRAIELGGRPHWGQQNTLQAHQVNTLYGDNVRRWRAQLGEVVGSARTFSNDYTQQRGLEPGPVERVVTAVRRAAGRITHLANPAEAWSPLPVDEFIAAFDAEHALVVGRSAFPPRLGVVNYFVQPSDPALPRSRVVVEHVLSTTPDESRLNNLRSLPPAPEAYAVYPSASLLRRRVTSVVRNRWGGVIALCNDAERWRVPDEIAYYEILTGGVEYYVEVPDGSEPTLIQARRYVSTFADGVAGNNLSELPEDPSG